MLSVLCLLLALADGGVPRETRSFKLDTLFSVNLDSQTVPGAVLLENGQIALKNFYTVEVFDAQGRKLCRLGRKGEGPGEFQFANFVFWSGTHYWVQDTVLMRFGVFDVDGSFIRWVDGKGVDKIMSAGSAYYLQDQSNLREGLAHIPLLRPVNFEGTELHKGDAFHNIPELSRKWRFNNRDHFIASLDGALYVIAQVDPTLWRYDGIDQAATHHDLMLPYWAELPEQWMMKRDVPKEQRIRWWNSWSRVMGIWPLGGRLLVHYGYPDPKSEGDWIMASVLVSPEGQRLTRRPLVLDGRLVGTYGDELYLIEEQDTDMEAFPSYEVHVYQW